MLDLSKKLQCYESRRVSPLSLTNKRGTQRGILTLDVGIEVQESEVTCSRGRAQDSSSATTLWIEKCGVGTQAESFELQRCQCQSLGISVLEGSKEQGQWLFTLMCLYFSLSGAWFYSSRKFWVLNTYSKTCPLFLYSFPECRHLFCTTASSLWLWSYHRSSKESLFP